MLLRFVEPPGLRAGPSAHPGSAQPEPNRMGLNLWSCFGLCFWPGFCGSLSRAVRCHPMRRTATRRSSLHSPLTAHSYRLRANSSVPVSTVGPQPLDAEGTHSVFYWPPQFNIRSPLASAENEPGRLVMNWATGRTRQLWAVNEVLLLRLAESRGPDAREARNTPLTRRELRYLLGRPAIQRAFTQ